MDLGSWEPSWSKFRDFYEGTLNEIHDDKAMQFAVVGAGLAAAFFLFYFWHILYKQIVLTVSLFGLVSFWMLLVNYYQRKLKFIDVSDLTSLDGVIHTLEQIRPHQQKFYAFISDFAVMTGLSFFLFSLLYSKLPCSLCPSWMPCIGELDLKLMKLMKYVGFILFVASTGAQIYNEINGTIGHRCAKFLLSDYTTKQNFARDFIQVLENAVDDNSRLRKKQKAIEEKKTAHEKTGFLENPKEEI